jgi:hypothetical protein
MQNVVNNKDRLHLCLRKQSNKKYLLQDEKNH